MASEGVEDNTYEHCGLFCSLAGHNCICRQCWALPVSVAWRSILFFLLLPYYLTSILIPLGLGMMYESGTRPEHIGWGTIRQLQSSIRLLTTHNRPSHLPKRRQHARDDLGRSLRYSVPQGSYLTYLISSHAR